MVEIFDTTGDNCEGKKQSTFLSLNKCSVDSPPPRCKLEPKIQTYSGTGEEPRGAASYKGGTHRKGFQKPNKQETCFSAPLAPDKRGSSPDRAGDQKRINHLFPAWSGEFIPPAWRRNILMHRNIKEPRIEIHYVCPSCDFSNMRVHALSKTNTVVSSPLIEHNSS